MQTIQQEWLNSKTAIEVQNKNNVAIHSIICLFFGLYSKVLSYRKENEIQDVKLGAFKKFGWYGYARSECTLVDAS